MKRILILIALLSAACSSGPPAPPRGDVPGAFAVQLEVKAAKGNGAQRITLPAAALVALRDRDFGDVRVFDHRGHPLATALEGTITGPEFLPSFHEVAATPMAVGVDAGSKSSGPLRKAVLLDTRSIDRPVNALFIRAILPKYVAATFKIESSSDLKKWDLLGEKLLYRTAVNADFPDVLNNSRFAMHGTNLRGRYLKLSWVAAPGVNATGATVAMPFVREQPRIALPTKGAALSNPHEIKFSVSFSTPLAAIRLSRIGLDEPVPIELYGRDELEQPWSMLARGVMRQDGATIELELSGAKFNLYKLVADSRTSGFTRAPKLDLMVEPLTVLAMFNGQAPYRLAAGNQSNRNGFRSVQEIAGSAEKGLSLPAATVDTGRAQVPIDITFKSGGDIGEPRSRQTR